MTRRSAAGLVVLAGLGLIGLALGTRLFDRANAFERMSAQVRPVMNTQAITALEADAVATRSLAAQLPSAVPALGRQVGLTPAQTAQFVAQFPDVQRGVAALPAISSRLDATVQTLRQELPRFRSADAIPTTDRSSTSVPWFILLCGIAGVVIGFLMLAPARIGAALAMLLGAIVIAAPLATSLPSKTANADRLNRDLATIFSPAGVALARQDLATMQAFGTEMQAGLVPAISARVGMTPQQFLSTLPQTSPVLAAALGNLPAVTARMSAVVNSTGRAVGDFATARGTRYVWITWTSIGAGVLILLFGVWSEAAETAVRAQETQRHEATRRAA